METLMNNVISFPHNVRAPQRQSVPTAKDRRYFVTDLETSALVAAYFYKDMRGADLLMEEIKKMYRSGVSLAHLSVEIRTQCALYLKPSEDVLRKTLDVIYRPVKDEIGI